MGRILVACEFSGVVRDAFNECGHEAFSCDILPTDRYAWRHIQDDVQNFLNSGIWDLMIAHPPCTYLANSGNKHLYLLPGRFAKMHAAAAFFRKLLNAPIPRICIENPIMRQAYERVGRKQDQVIQPWQFGHREMKATCLWLKNLPILKPTMIVGPPPKDIIERRQWARVHRAPPSSDRWKIRSRTFEGIAKAMAEQWGPLL